MSDEVFREKTSQRIFFCGQEPFRRVGLFCEFIYNFYIPQARLESGETGVTGTCRTRRPPSVWVREAWLWVVQAGSPPHSSPRRAAASAHPPRPATTDSLTTTTKQVGLEISTMILEPVVAIPSLGPVHNVYVPTDSPV